jgi:hypothetical protein
MGTYGPATTDPAALHHDRVEAFMVRAQAAVVWADTSEEGGPEEEDGLVTSNAVGPARSL